MRNEWCVSQHGEDYYGEFATRDDAIAEGVGMGWETFYVGRSEPVTAESTMPNGWDILEHMSNAACDQVGDHAGDWPHANKESRDRLTQKIHAAIAEWVKETDNEPGFFAVVGEEKIELQGDES